MCFFFFFPLLATGNQPQRANLRRGRSLLAREEDVHESGLALFNRGTLRRKKTASSSVEPKPKDKKGCFDNIGPGPKDGWFIYCYILTCFVPPFLLKSCGEFCQCIYAWAGLNVEQVSVHPNNKEHGEKRWACFLLLFRLWPESVSSLSALPKLSVGNHQIDSSQVTLRTLRSSFTATITTSPISSTLPEDRLTAMQTLCLKETGTQPVQIFHSCSRMSIKTVETSSPRPRTLPSPETTTTSIGISHVTSTISSEHLQPTSPATTGPRLATLAPRLVPSYRR